VRGIGAVVRRPLVRAALPDVLLERASTDGDGPEGWSGPGRRWRRESMGPSLVGFCERRRCGLIQTTRWDDGAIERAARVLGCYEGV